MTLRRETTQTNYEWDIETTDEHGDIIDHNWSDVFPGIPTEEDCHLVLIKDVARGIAGEPDSFALDHRTWAYVKDGHLPLNFEDGTMVPTRFLKHLN